MGAYLLALLLGLVRLVARDDGQPNVRFLPVSGEMYLGDASHLECCHVVRAVATHERHGAERVERLDHQRLLFWRHARKHLKAPVSRVIRCCERTSTKDTRRASSFVYVSCTCASAAPVKHKFQSDASALSACTRLATVNSVIVGALCVKCRKGAFRSRLLTARSTRRQLW